MRIPHASDERCPCKDDGSTVVRSILVALFACAALAQSGEAQSTIFNIPTTDTVTQGKFYAEFDYLAQAPKAAAGDRLHVFVPRAVVGVAPNVEAGVNVAFLHSGSTTNAFLQPNLKWKFLNKEGTAASAGFLIYTPLNNRKGVDTFGMVYANISQKVDHAFGPRFTAGPYGLIGTDQSFAGPEAGAILGYEQPLHPKVSVVADWFSGENGFGYFTPGVSFTLPAGGLVNAGYSLGNDSYASSSTRNRLFFIYYGKTF